MALSINWATKVITVPQADLAFVSGVIYEHDVDAFQRELSDIGDSEIGVAHLPTHRHNTQIVLAGVTYVRSVEIINGYTVTYESGSYRVNLVGANNNIIDVLNYNNVQVVPNNSAGLIVVTSGSGLSTPQDERLTRIEKFLRNKTITDPVTGKQTVFDDDGSSVLAEGDLFEDAAGAQPYRGQGAERRERLA